MKNLLVLMGVVLLCCIKASPVIAATKKENQSVKAGPGFTDPITFMEFVLVKGGCYAMGDSFGDGDDWEKPVHKVCLDDFYIGMYEVTRGQFRRFADSTGYVTDAEKDGWCARQKNMNWKNIRFQDDDTHPVVCVSWNDARAFAIWLAAESGKAIRLPTEAEWEYAARSGGKRYKYSWGNGDPSGNIADESLKKVLMDADLWDGTTIIWDQYKDGYLFTAPAGRFKPNELGLYDMTGNVFEWVSDRYDENYYAHSPQNNPRGPSSGPDRIIRGGSWGNVPRPARASTRIDVNPGVHGANLGFRLVSPSVR